MYKVTLYYQFSPIDDPRLFCQKHKQKCRSLNLLGRVYASGEGINGTLSGMPADIEAYQSFLRSLKGFAQTQFKEDHCETIPFVKLIVKTRPEIVSLKSSIAIDPTKEKGHHLTPKQWRDALESDEDYTLLDVRNDYESNIGHFKDAVKPDVENFYDFPEWVDQQNFDKDKKVLMYCTGGIRCEVFSVFMAKKGFNNVHQLQGGIINYAKEQDGAHYIGKCFVFDDRLSIPIEQDQKEPISKCAITHEPCDTYLNCANMECNKLFICSVEGAKKYQGCCSEQCLKLGKRRPVDSENIYEPSRKWYEYFSDKHQMNQFSERTSI